MGNLNKCALLTKCATSAKELDRWWDRAPYKQYMVSLENTSLNDNQVRHVYYKVAPIQDLPKTGFTIAASLSHLVCPFLDQVLWTGECKGRRFMSLLPNLQPNEKYAVQVSDCKITSAVAPYNTMWSFPLCFQLAVVCYTLECYQIMLNSNEVGIRRGVGFSNDSYLLVNDKVYNLGSDNSFNGITIVNFSWARRSSAEYPFIKNLDWLYNIRETFLRLTSDHKQELLDVLLPKHMQFQELINLFEGGDDAAIRVLCQVVNPLPECISKLAALGNIEEHSVAEFLKDHDLNDVFILDKSLFDDQGNLHVPEYPESLLRFQEEQQELGTLHTQILRVSNELWGNEAKVEDDENKSCWFESEAADQQVSKDFTRHIDHLTSLYEDPVQKREVYHQKIASARFLLGELERLLAGKDTPLTVPPTLEHLFLPDAVFWSTEEQVSTFLNTYNTLFLTSVTPLFQQPLTMIQQLLLQNRVTPQLRPVYLDGPHEVQVLTLPDGKLVYLFGEEHRAPSDVLTNGSGVEHAGNRMLFNQYITLLSHTSRAFVDLYVEISTSEDTVVPTSYVDIINALTQSSSYEEFEQNYRKIVQQQQVKPQSKKGIFTANPSTVMSKFIFQLQHPEEFGMLCNTPRGRPNDQYGCQHRDEQLV